MRHPSGAATSLASRISTDRGRGPSGLRNVAARERRGADKAPASPKARIRVSLALLGLPLEHQLVVPFLPVALAHEKT